MGGSVKAEGLGDGCLESEKAIAKLRLTLPPLSIAPTSSSLFILDILHLRP